MSATLIAAPPAVTTREVVPQTATESTLYAPLRPSTTLHGSGDQAKLVVVGEHLEPEAEPFTSPAGVAFKELLLEAGLPVQKLAFCHSGPATGVLLEHAGAQYVLASGQKALDLWRRDLLMRQCHGRPFYVCAEGPIVWPVFSHVALLRDPRWRAIALEEIHLLRRLALAKLKDEDWTAAWPDSCVKCRGPVWRCDPQTVMYCHEHWDQRVRWGPPL